MWYFTAVFTLALSAWFLYKFKHWLFIVPLIIIPFITITIDYFIDGDQTLMRQMFSVIYSAVLIVTLLVTLKS